jgi:hypothetical protein
MQSKACMQQSKLAASGTCKANQNIKYNYTGQQQLRCSNHDMLFTLSYTT